MKKVYKKSLETLFSGPAKPIKAKPYHFSLSTQPELAIATVPPNTFTTVSWNLLAPPYNRRVKLTSSSYIERVTQQINFLKTLHHVDFFLLQEFWCTEEHLNLWKSFCEEFGFSMFVWKRTGSKVDGCCTLVRGNSFFSSFETRGYSFNDYGNRICSIVSFKIDQTQKVYLLNTHFTFEHKNQHDPLQRVHQGRKLVEIVNGLVEKDFNAGDFLVVSGDFNGNVDNRAVKECLEGIEKVSEEFCLCLNVSSEHLPSDFVSHFDHNKNLMGCDFTVVLSNEKTVIDEVILKVDVGENLASWELSDHSLLETKFTVEDSHRRNTGTINKM